MAALGKSGNPVSLGLPALLRFHRLAKPIALTIHLENVAVVGQTVQQPAVIRSPWKIWFHSLNGRLLVTRMLPRS